MSLLLDALKTSRVRKLRQGIIKTLKDNLPECEVRPHPGKIDMADVLDGKIFVVPSIVVAVIRQRAADHRMSGTRDVPVEIAAYIVTDDQALGNPPKRYERDEIGLALGDVILSLIENPDISRWDQENIDYPSDAQFQPLFTAKSYEKGVAFYAVTWRQTLYHRGEPWWGAIEPPPLIPAENKP